MRLVDADKLLEHVYRDKLDSRELIAEMIEKAPTVEEFYEHIVIYDKFGKPGGEALLDKHRMLIWHETITVEFAKKIGLIWEGENNEHQ